MTKLLSIAVVLALAASAQKAPAPQPTGPQVHRVVELKHLSGERASQVRNLLWQFMEPGTINLDPELKTAVLKGSPEAVAGAEALLKRLDVPATTPPSQQVRFTIYLVEGSQAEGAGGAIPKDIAPAVEQMRNAFAYKNYRLLDTILLVGRSTDPRDGRPLALNGVLPDRTTKTTYLTSYNNAQVLDDGKSVSLRNFNFEIRSPDNVSSMRSDLLIRAGQKLVLGKLAAQPGDAALFLILTADIQ